MVEPKLQSAVIGALIGQLRSLADFDARAGEPLGLCMREAADALEAISAENAKMETVLERVVQALAGRVHSRDALSALGDAEELLAALKEPRA